MSNDGPDEPFLSRWSRQKRQIVGATPEAEAPEVAPAELEVDLSKLPNIEELTADSDITGFLQKGVPDALQRMALRRMWSLDPAIRDFVEVAENQWDFNAVGGIPGLFQEIPPGTDVSYWLTQATPSALPGTVLEPPIRTVHAGGLDAAQQQIPIADDRAEPTTRSDVDLQPSMSSQQPILQRQPAVNVEEPDKEAEFREARASLQRRRHGGALPR